MGKTEQQIVHSLLLTPGSGINVDDYRKLCEQIENKEKKVVYVDANGIGLQKSR